MSKRIWVKISKQDRYDGFKSEWRLGTIVGKTTLPYQEQYSLKSMLEAPQLVERYLIELDSGEIEEAWYFDTYEPDATDVVDPQSGSAKTKPHSELAQGSKDGK